jgi:hypothetical protein
VGKLLVKIKNKTFKTKKPPFQVANYIYCIDLKPKLDYYHQRLKPLAVVKSCFFLNNIKKAKCCLLAPIAVKILMSRGSGHKIAA